MLSRVAGDRSSGKKGRRLALQTPPTPAVSPKETRESDAEVTQQMILCTLPIWVVTPQLLAGDGKQDQMARPVRSAEGGKACRQLTVQLSCFRACRSPVSQAVLRPGSILEGACARNMLAGSDGGRHGGAREVVLHVGSQTADLNSKEHPRCPLVAVILVLRWLGAKVSRTA